MIFVKKASLILTLFLLFLIIFPQAAIALPPQKENIREVESGYYAFDEKTKSLSFRGSLIDKFFERTKISASNEEEDLPFDVIEHQIEFNQIGKATFSGDQILDFPSKGSYFLPHYILIFEEEERVGGKVIYQKRPLSLEEKDARFDIVSKGEMLVISLKKEACGKSYRFCYPAVVPNFKK